MFSDMTSWDSRSVSTERCWDGTMHLPTRLMAVLRLCPYGKSYSTSYLCKLPKSLLDEHADIWRSNTFQYFKSLTHKHRLSCEQKFPLGSFLFHMKALLVEDAKNYCVTADNLSSNVGVYFLAEIFCSGKYKLRMVICES